MASDRGTLPRTGIPGIDQQGAWPEPTVPADRRMPSAPRERKPALFALAVLLVALGAGATGWLVLRIGHRVGAVEIVQPVSQGQQIPVSAMKEVEISSDSGIDYVSWSDADQVSRFFAASAIPAGTLLTSDMVSSSTGLTAGREVVGLSLKAGQLPVNLQIGDQVRAFAMAGSSVCQVVPGATLAADAVVTEVSGSTSVTGSSVAVNIAVDPADAGPLVCTSSNGDVGIALLPGNS
jgi:hypothetical protein